MIDFNKVFYHFNFSQSCINNYCDEEKLFFVSSHFTMKFAVCGIRQTKAKIELDGR